VSGRANVDFRAWIRMDLDYIDRGSPAVDLTILAMTIPPGLIGRGAD
jgi:lipopolysaccharide/colanic/teichoic acid biosynthesis glycosyltransferase